MGHRPQTKEYENSPGPAAYYPSVSNIKDSSPAFTMGMQRAPYKAQELSPGPNYDVRPDWDRGVRFGKEKRLQSAGREISQPGPGNYNIKSTFDDKNKGPHMAGRYDNSTRASSGAGGNSFPGPGTYYLKDVRNGPHYSLSGSRKGERRPESPGPAHYEVCKSYNDVYNSRPNTVFTSGRKDSYTNDISPGPGTYYYNFPNAGGVSMKWRYPSDERERSPGPAAYNQKWKTIENMANSNKLVGSSMGSATFMNFHPKDNTPGPGQYYSPSKYDKGTKFTTGGRGGQKLNDSPGPGHYYIPCTVADVPRYVLPVQNERYKWV